MNPDICSDKVAFQQIGKIVVWTGSLLLCLMFIRYIQSHLVFAMSKEEIEYLLTETYKQHGSNHISYSESTEIITNMKENVSQLRILIGGELWTISDLVQKGKEHVLVGPVISNIESVREVLNGLVYQGISLVTSTYILIRNVSTVTMDTANLGQTIGHVIWAIYMVLLYRGVQLIVHLMSMFTPRKPPPPVCLPICMTIQGNDSVLFLSNRTPSSPAK